MKQAKPISRQLIEACKKEYEDSCLCKAMNCAVSKTELAQAAFDGEAARKLDMTFAIDLCSSGVTWQKASGRCGIFAAMNILREKAAAPILLSGIVPWTGFCRESVTAVSGI